MIRLMIFALAFISTSVFAATNLEQCLKISQAVPGGAMACYKAYVNDAVNTAKQQFIKNFMSESAMGSFTPPPLPKSDQSTQGQSGTTAPQDQQKSPIKYY